MEKYEKTGRINPETGLLAVEQRDLAGRVYDSLSDNAKRIALYTIPAGLAILVTGCASVPSEMQPPLGERILRILDEIAKNPSG